MNVLVLSWMLVEQGPLVDTTYILVFLNALYSEPFVLACCTSLVAQGPVPGVPGKALPHHPGPALAHDGPGGRPAVAQAVGEAGVKLGPRREGAWVALVSTQH